MMKRTMKRFVALMLCAMQLFACLPAGHMHAHAEACAHQNAQNTNTYYILAAGGKWEDNGDGTHTGLSQMVNWWYCYDCSTGWGENVGEPAMRTEPHEYRDNRCLQCGVVTACAHPKESLTKERLWFSVEGYDFEPLDGDNHVLINEPAFKWTCGDCGETWYDHATGKLDELIIRHLYADGGNVCLQCGYVDDCAHTSTTTVRKVTGPLERDGFIMTPTTHTGVYQSYDAVVCADCGKAMGETSNWTEYQQAEEHLYTDSYVCFICEYQGSACNHENRTHTGGHKEKESFVRVDATTHLHMFDVYWDYACADCGESYSLFIEHGSEVRDHAFIVDPNLTACNQCGMTKPCVEHSRDANGVCTVCGDCPHASSTVRDYSSVAHDPEPYDAKFHQVLNVNTYKRECNTCGVEFMKNSSYVVYVAHAYDADGVCACGATGTPSTCAHPNENYATYEDNVVYSEITADQHTKTYDYYFYFTCVDCGEPTQYEVLLGRTVTQNHTLVDGVCACGYSESGCTHANVTVKGEWANAVYTKVNDEIHHAVYDYVEVHICDDCGYTEEVLIDTGREDDEPHEWLIMNPDVTDCRFCGAVKPCETHDWEFAEGDSDDMVCSVCGKVCSHEWGELDRQFENNKREFTKIDDTTHSYVYDLYNRYSCTVCIAKHTELAAEGLTATANHDFVDDESLTECSACGAVKLCETHTYVDGMCTVCGYACAHENMTDHGKWANAVYTKLDEEMHHAVYDYVIEHHCSDCGYTYDQLIEAGREDDEPHEWLIMNPNATDCRFCGAVKPCETHTYVDGVCTVCGHACAHENMTDHGKWANAVYTKLDEEMHHAVYDYVIEHHCSDCGYTYDQLIEAGREDDEPHEWFMNPNAMDCRFCGAVKPCETHDWEFAEGDSDDMVCSVCGKVCSHEWGALDRQFENNKREFTKIDDTTHSYVYDLYNRYSCTVCIAKHTELAAEGLTATANHDFVDDESLTECSACGAVKQEACAHPNVQHNNTYYSLCDGGEWKDNGDGTHSGMSCLVYWWYCPDCDYGWEEPVTEPAMNTEPHDLEDGICYRCGFENTCEHPKASLTKEKLWFTVEGEKCVPLDGDYHVLLNEPALKWQCGVCGEVWFDHATGVLDEMVLDHVYEDGSNVCVECGFVNDCAHTETKIVQKEVGPIESEGMRQTTTTHTFWYQSHDAEVCVDCGKDMRNNSNWQTYSKTEPHRYTDGYCCFDCGYHGSECPHENSTQTGGHKENERFARIDAASHLHLFDVHWDYACADCGESYSLYMESGSEVRDHAFIADPSLTTCTQCGLTKPCAEHSRGENGVCTVCGDCPHTDNIILDYRSEPSDPEAYNDAFHKVISTSIMECECMTCGVRFMDYSSYVVYQAHRYDESGVCECGATGEMTTCAHASEEYATGEANVVYSEITEESHKKTYDAYFYFRCRDCGIVTQYEELLGYEKTEEHNLENGACECGYGKVGCAEHAYVDGVCSVCGTVSSCLHANAVQKGGYKTNEAFLGLDEMTHVHTFSVWHRFNCPDCGETYSVYLEDGYEVDDHAFHYDPSLTVCNQCGMNKPCTEHTFDGMGICTTCGYCLHQWTSGSEFIGMEMLDPVNQDDDQFHVQPYLSLSKRTCNNCQKTFVKASKMEGEEGHTFDENGLCACGATGTPTTCEHENVEFGPMDVVVYSDKTLTQHTVKTDVYWTGWCPDCETYRMRQLDMPGTAETVNHTYVDGTCSACGHYYLTGIENVYALPEGLKEIEAEAFVENNVEAVIVPDSCVKIGAVAFADCAQLKVVVLPSNTENISRDAFTGCPDVVLFVAEGSAAKAFCETFGYEYLVVE